MDTDLLHLTCASVDSAVVSQLSTHCLNSSCVQLPGYEIFKVCPVVLLRDPSTDLDTCVLKQIDRVEVHVSCASAPGSPETAAEGPREELEVLNLTGNWRGGWR